MKVLSTLWGLLVDDERLVWTLVAALILAAITSLLLNLPFAGSIVIWLGIIVSLVISVEHQLKLKTKTK